MSTGLDGEDPLESSSKENQQLQTMCIIFCSFQGPQLREYRTTVSLIYDRWLTLAQSSKDPETRSQEPWKLAAFFLATKVWWGIQEIEVQEKHR